MTNTELIINNLKVNENNVSNFSDEDLFSCLVYCLNNGKYLEVIDVLLRSLKMTSVLQSEEAYANDEKCNRLRFILGYSFLDFHSATGFTFYENEDIQSLIEAHSDSIRIYDSKLFILKMLKTDKKFAISLLTSEYFGNAFYEDTEKEIYNFIIDNYSEEEREFVYSGVNRIFWLDAIDDCSQNDMKPTEKALQHCSNKYLIGISTWCDEATNRQIMKVLLERKDFIDLLLIIENNLYLCSEDYIGIIVEQFNHNQALATSYPNITRSFLRQHFLKVNKHNYKLIDNFYDLELDEEFITLIRNGEVECPSLSYYNFRLIYLTDEEKLNNINKITIVGNIARDIVNNLQTSDGLRRFYLEYHDVIDLNLDNLIRRAMILNETSLKFYFMNSSNRLTFLRTAISLSAPYKDILELFGKVALKDDLIKFVLLNQDILESEDVIRYLDRLPKAYLGLFVDTSKFKSEVC